MGFYYGLEIGEKRSEDAVDSCSSYQDDAEVYRYSDEGFPHLIHSKCIAF